MKPGTRLKTLLAKFGFKPSPGCSCERIQELMDEWGVEKCHAKSKHIAGMLMKEAVNRGYPRNKVMFNIILKVVRHAIATSTDR